MGLLLLAASLDDVAIAGADEGTPGRINLSDPVHLLTLLREHSVDGVDESHVPRLIEDLATADPRLRKDAVKYLVGLGYKSVPKLREALADEQRRGAALACLEYIYSGPSVREYAAVVQTLLKQRPGGTVEALLRYLPSAPSEDVEEDIWFGLYALIKRKEEIDPSLLKVLADPIPARRALAGLIVARLGDEPQRAAAARLLKDANGEVRLRVAQGFLAGNNAKAIPVLVDLLVSATWVTQAWQAEELLHWAARESGPETMVGSGSPDLRKKCRSAWEKWWAESEAGFKVESRRRLRPLLMFRFRPYDRPYADPKHVSQMAWFLHGHDGKTRWRFRDLTRGVQNVQLLPRDRVLVPELPWHARVKIESGEFVRESGPDLGVTESDFSGRVLWQYKWVKNPIACVRLPDGNTLIHGTWVDLVSPTGALFFRKDLGDEVKMGGVFARLLPEGLIVLADRPGPRLHRIAEIDLYSAYQRKADDSDAQVILRPTDVWRAGPLEQIKRSNFIVPEEVLPAGGLLPLRNGNYLITIHRSILELDRKGRKVWEYSLGIPEGLWCIARLRDGSILNLCGRPPAEKLVEIDSSGGIVASLLPPTRGFLGGAFQIVAPLVRLGFDGGR